MSKLEIYTLGNPQIILEGKAITNNISSKATALLCYMALNPDRAFSRDKLSMLLWDSNTAESARYNLRYTLWSLRKILRDTKDQTEFIEAHKESCGMNCDADIYIDACEIECLSNKSCESEDAYIYNLEKIRSLYKGEFLEGFYLNKCMEFNDWVFFERERFQRKYYEALNNLAEAYKNRKEYTKLIALYNEMLRINPLQEDIYLKLIETYLETGERNSALVQYSKCCDMLRNELNISPDENIKSVYSKIQNYKIQYEADNENNEAEVHSVILGDNNVNLNKEAVCITVNCVPVSLVNYYWLSILLGELINKISDDVLLGMPAYIWSSLSRIHINACKFTKDSYSTEILTASTERIRLYTAMEEMLNIITDNCKLAITSKDFHNIDKASTQFLLLYFSKRRKNITLTITGDFRDNKLIELESLKL